MKQFGGHKYAAGLSIRSENFEEFARRFEDIVKQKADGVPTLPEIEYDLRISISDINPGMLNIINQMAPFGPGNMIPVFRSDSMHSNGSARVLKDKHLKMTVHQQGSSLDSIGFGMSHHIHSVSNRNLFHACYCIEENTFNGRTNLQLKLKDIKN
jgi:single-stranded-DNA-specific exonuclease